MSSRSARAARHDPTSFSDYRKVPRNWSRGQVTAPIFLLVPQVKMPKRLDLRRYAERARHAVPRLIAANWVDEG